MSALLAYGINHKTAPIAVREQFAFDASQAQHFLRSIHDQGLAEEVALLSTCNRTELYCQTQHQTTILNWLQARHPILQPHSYCHADQAAIQHMLRVANGLDSMVLGETQILGQMKTAFATAQDAGTLGPHLHRLFQSIFCISKQIRHETALSAGPLSVATTAISLTKRVFTDLKQKTVLLIGAGETIEQVAQHLQQLEANTIIIANRTRSKAHKIASLCQGSIIPIEAIPQHAPQADLIISATASRLPIIGKGLIEHALKVRHHRPMLIIDLAVPRDVEEQVAQLDDVYLYTVDDLQSLIKEHFNNRLSAAKQAEQRIEIHSQQLLQQAQANYSDVISNYRQTSRELAKAELTKHLKLIRQGHCPELVLQQLTHRLTNKLLHEPSLAIKQLGQDKASILAQIRQLLEID